MPDQDNRKGQAGPLPGTSADAADAPTVTAALSAPPTSGTAPLEDGTGRTPGPGAGPAILEHGQRFGPYTIVRLLGSGGMGSVYEAEEAESGRRVALKLLSRPLATAEERDRFLREGRLAASISHPHSVYVFGTGEVQGLPIISMELAAGGTLKDAIKARGPLPSREAVDAVLQVIAGLEAAAAAGVLHRDIKPANCFVDRDGTVKVGDFGLSTSMLPRDETHLTLAGTIMGTPAFASPEQLRGEDLDVRSDIYSVGATLYYLLTGRAPFEETNVVRLLTMVMQEMPPAPLAVRREIPKELSAVVLRALAKRPAERFADYAALRTALEPFGSTVPEPASLGLRIAAYLVDYSVLVILGTLSYSFAAVLLGTRATPDFMSMISGIRVSPFFVLLAPFINALYWVLLEGLWGASLGKRIFGLRVTGAGGEPAGIRGVLIRTLVFVGVPFTQGTLPWLLPLPDLQDFLIRNMTAIGGVGALAYWLAPMLILFSTARRRNGWAGLHELAGRTRVMAKNSREQTPVRMATTEAPIAFGHTRVGPYALVGEASAGPGFGILNAWDERLRRPVWLHFVDPGVTLPAWRRDLARPARLRWLAGRRSETAAWDAYEAVEGRPFLAAVRTPQPWKTVRGWLRDLSEEIEAGLNDGSLPTLDLDRLWVGADGRIRLLDWPAPEGAHEANVSGLSAPTPVDLSTAQAFLNLVARTSIDGRASDRGGGGAPAAAPIPLAASGFLSDLAGARFASAGEIAARASAMVVGPATVSRGRRAVHLALSGLPPLVLFLSMWLTVVVFMPLITSDKSGVFTYVQELEELEKMETAPDTSETRAIREAREIDIAARFPQFLNTKPESARIIGAMPQPVQRLAARIRANHPNPSPEEVRRARELLAPIYQKEAINRKGPAEIRKTALSRLPDMTLMVWVFSALLGLLLALAVRGGLMLRLLGVAAVDRMGREVPRWRSGLRALVAWLPILVAGVARISLGPAYGRWAVWPPVLLFFAGVVYAVLRPERGLQDRIAGTWLVPR